MGIFIEQHMSIQSSRNYPAPASQKSSIWLYGKHACFAILNNKKRRILRILLTANMAKSFPFSMDLHPVDIVDPKHIEHHVPKAAVHQGIAVQTFPLPSLPIEAIIGKNPILALDQVTDPQNMGAILRSAAAFNAAAILTPKHHAPHETPALVKAACGAFEIVPVIKVGNLVQTLKLFKKHNYWCIGMDGHATQTLPELAIASYTLIVMGSEGKGLRKLTRTHCDILAKLPISSHVESLNVSVAAAITLYHLYQLTL